LDGLEGVAPGGVNLSCRRRFGVTEELEWETLTQLVEGVVLNEDVGTVSWVFEKFGEFTTMSLYRELLFQEWLNRWMTSIWKANLALKINKKNLWQVCNDKLQSAEQLKKRN
jgi:hypothetical protein